MKVLVTGSCGFIFSNFIIYALQETKWDLVSLDKLTYAGSLLNISHNTNVYNKRHRFYLGDVCDYHFVKKVLEIEKPDVIVHGAAESFVDSSIENPNVFMQTNAIGTQNIFQAALNTQVQKIINISTDEVTGSIDKGSFKEDAPLKPRNPYAASKAAADLLGYSYFITYGLPVITTRSANNFGPRQHWEKLIPKVITNILTNREIPLYGDGKNVREWIYVKDNFHAIKTLIEKGVVGEVYNISSGTEKQNIEILDAIFATMGGNELLRQVKDRPGHDRRYSANCDKIKALGWEPAYPFEDALRHTINWYKANTWFWKKQIGA